MFRARGSRSDCGSSFDMFLISIIIEPIAPIRRKDDGEL
jgi:hypothetical protein